MRRMHVRAGCLLFALIISISYAGPGSGREGNGAQRAIADMAARLAREADVLEYETGRAIRLRPRQEGIGLGALFELRVRAGEFMRLTGQGCTNATDLRRGFDLVDEAWKFALEALAVLPGNKQSGLAEENVDALIARLGACVPEPILAGEYFGRSPDTMLDFVYALKRQSETLLHRSALSADVDMDRRELTAIKRRRDHLSDLARIANQMMSDVLDGRDHGYVASRLPELNRHLNAAWRLYPDLPGSNVAMQFERFDLLIVRLEQAIHDADAIAYDAQP